jgi:acetylglutamate kinase
MKVNSDMSMSSIDATGTTDPARRAAILIEALPHIRRFQDTIIVVKYGGNALAGASEADALSLFAQDLVLMRLVGLRPIVVHGGGPQITDLLAKVGKKTEFRNGLRVTDAETMDIVRMVLIGKVNPQIVSEINVFGHHAVGVSGEDAGLIQATPRDSSLGFVGDVQEIRPELLYRLLDDDFIPVVATIGVDESGQAYNINADTVASSIAVAVKAEKLIYLTDVEGLRSDVDDPTSLISAVTARALEEMIAKGTVSDGMIPKVQGCIDAVRSGVGRAHVLDGRQPHVLLLELFTDAGIGTMIEGDR